MILNSKRLLIKIPRYSFPVDLWTKSISFHFISINNKLLSRLDEIRKENVRKICCFAGQRDEKTTGGVDSPPVLTDHHQSTIVEILIHNASQRIVMKKRELLNTIEHSYEKILIDGLVNRFLTRVGIRSQ
jgi:hypothetical protein